MITVHIHNYGDLVQDEGHENSDNADDSDSIDGDSDTDSG